MPTAEKERTIERARDWYTRSVGVVFTDYRGLKVKEMQQLRRDVRAKGGELHVLKNTLFRIAAGDDTANMPAELHNGTTAIAFVFENEAACTKTLFDYAKTNKALKVKGGFFGGKAFDAKQMERISELPPRDVLIAQVIGTIVAPLTNLVSVIEALYADPIRVIGAVADKVGKSNPIPAAKRDTPEDPQVHGKPTGEPESKVDEAPVSASIDESASAAPAVNEESVESPATTAPPEGTIETGIGSHGSEEASVESAPASDAQPEAPPPDQPAETSEHTNSTESAPQ